MIEVPNLELILYKFSQELPKGRTGDGRVIGVFQQYWPNTAGGFQQPGICSGQMFITQYTTVIQYGDTYGVFFGNNLGYIVEDPAEVFFEDLLNDNMACVGDKDKYDRY